MQATWVDGWANQNPVSAGWEWDGWQASEPCYSFFLKMPHTAAELDAPLPAGMKGHLQRDPSVKAWPAKQKVQPWPNFKTHPIRFKTTQKVGRHKRFKDAYRTRRGLISQKQGDRLLVGCNHNCSAATKGTSLNKQMLE